MVTSYFLILNDFNYLFFLISTNYKVISAFFKVQMVSVGQTNQFFSL